MPIRIQRKRIRGWKKPTGAVNCTRPGMYGNPFKIGEPLIINAAVAKKAFEHWIEISPPGKVLALMAKKELKGKDLMCFCSLDEPCHVDVLLRIANE